jgi:hypothetical protein
LLMADAQARLLTFRNEYTFDDVSCGWVVKWRSK